MELRRYAGADPPHAVHDLPGAAGRELSPTAAILDSRGVKGAENGGAAIDPSGYDAGKTIRGKTRHVLVDAHGPVMHALVHPASVQDRTGGALSDGHPVRLRSAPYAASLTLLFCSVMADDATCCGTSLAVASQLAGNATNHGSLQAALRLSGRAAQARREREHSQASHNGKLHRENSLAVKPNASIQVLFRHLRHSKQIILRQIIEKFNLYLLSVAYSIPGKR